MKKEEPITRMIKCDTCNCCTQTLLEKVGIKDNLLIISTKCSNCKHAGFLRLLEFEWNSIKASQIFIQFN